MRALLAPVAAGVVAITLVGCGGGDSGPLDDGRHFGYIQSVDASAAPATIEFDVAEFLSGEEANTAAEEDGVIAEGEEVPNDYYIRNDDKSLVILDVATDVAVTHIQCPTSCAEGIPGRFDAFAESFTDTSEKSLNDEYRGSKSQYWVTVSDGEVDAIDEQYLP